MDSPTPDPSEKSDEPKVRRKFRDDILPWFLRKPEITDEDGIIPRPADALPPGPARVLGPAIAVGVMVVAAVAGMVMIAEKGRESAAALAAATRGPNPAPVMLLLAPLSTPGPPFCRIEKLVKPHWSGE